MVEMNVTSVTYRYAPSIVRAALVPALRAARRVRTIRQRSLKLCQRQ